MRKSDFVAIVKNGLEEIQKIIAAHRKHGRKVYAEKLEAFRKAVEELTK